MKMKISKANQKSILITKITSYYNTNLDINL